MAEPSNGSPVSTLGFILLLLIVIGAGFCWFFNINPATFISEKLRGLQEVEMPAPSPSDVDANSGQETTPISSTFDDSQSSINLAGGGLAFYLTQTPS